MGHIDGIRLQGAGRLATDVQYLDLRHNITKLISI